MPINTVTPCFPCRKRHTKCDGLSPICSRCRRLKKKCTWPGLIIRNGLGGRQGIRFADDQSWIDISKTRLQFVDESSDLASHYGHYLPSTVSHSAKRQSLSAPDSPSSSSYCSSPPSTPGTGKEEGSQALPLPHTFLTPREDSGLGDDQLSTQTIRQSSTNIGTPQDVSWSSGACLPDLGGTWPYRNVQEAFLMKHFIDELSQWFDSCDQARHFRLVAPCRASHCPALFYGILSVSARHLSRRQRSNDNLQVSNTETPLGLEPAIALEYQSKCISHLMSLSGDATEVQDENLLAAAVVLRFYEELDEPLVGSDGETHLRGIEIFLNAQAGTAIHGRGLRNAAFWVAMRQKIRMAFIQQREIQFDLGCFQNSVYKTLEPTDDSTWANRVILHCAEVLSFCYGIEGTSLQKYEELSAFGHEWLARKPQSFMPMFCSVPNASTDGLFPIIWYSDDCHVIAMQHWHLAQILLTAFNPKLPRMGPTQKKAAADNEDSIKRNVFALCGIGMSNKTAPSLITASIGISMCGDRITDRAEQEALLEVLIRTDDHQALSTTKSQRQLREAWNWDLSPADG